MSKRNFERDPNWLRLESFSFGFCSRADCGLHMVGYPEDGSRPVEIVFSAKQTRQLVKKIQAIVYQRAALK